jgi:hypothetical protein
MTIAIVRTQIATLQRSIPGIITAYDQLPKGILKKLEMPLFINFVRDSSIDHDIYGDDAIQVSRQYLMWLIVKPVVEGIEGESESLVEPYIDTVLNFFYARPTLGLLTGIVDSAITADSGPKKMIWPGDRSDLQNVAWGCEFQLDVIEIVQRIYAPYE